MLVPNILGTHLLHVGKRCDKKAKVNLKIYGMAAWETNNSNTHMAQYIKKQSQSYNEIWLVNRIYREKDFSSKVM